MKTRHILSYISIVRQVEHLYLETCPSLGFLVKSEILVTSKREKSFRRSKIHPIFLKAEFYQLHVLASRLAILISKAQIFHRNPHTSRSTSRATSLFCITWEWEYKHPFRMLWILLLHLSLDARLLPLPSVSFIHRVSRCLQAIMEAKIKTYE